MAPPSNCLTRSAMKRSMESPPLIGPFGADQGEPRPNFGRRECRGPLNSGSELVPWPARVAPGPQLGDPLEITIGGGRAFARPLAHILDQGLGRLKAPRQHVAPVGVGHPL